MHGRAALVTGSRRGIGLAIADRLAGEGCAVGLAGRTPDDEQSANAVARVAAHGTRVTYVSADLANPAECRKMIGQFLQAHGRIDVLVNNAMDAAFRPVLELSDDDWRGTLDAILGSSFTLAQEAARAMVEAGQGGSIVNVSSAVHAHGASPLNAAYGVAKAGIERLTKTFAFELAGTGVRCNTVSPGWIDSRVLPVADEDQRGVRGYADDRLPLIPARRVGLPSDVTGVVAFLCSDEASYVNGTCLEVDGGFNAISAASAWCCRIEQGTAHC